MDNSAPWADFQSNAAPASAMPWNDFQPQKEGMIDTFIHGAETPFKPIINNTLESLKNTATQTGATMSEPMNTPGAADWGQHPVMGPVDAAVRGIGKAGNALGGVWGSLLSPVIGGASASVEPALPAIEKGISSVTGGDASQITPEQNHNLAMNTGGDLANAIMLGKAGIQGDERLNQQPVQPTAQSAPRASFMGSNSSDPMHTSAPTTIPIKGSEDLFDKADEYYEAANKGKPVLAAAPIQKGISDINNTLSQSNFDPDFHPQTAKWVSKLQNASTDDNGQPIDMTWTKLNGIRKLLNGVINDSRKSVVDGGGYSEDGYQAIQARNALNNTIDNFKPTDVVSGDPNAIAMTKQGNTLYKAGMDVDTIQSAVDKNMNKAVPATSIKGALDRIANKPSIMDKFTTEEQEAIQNGAKTGKMDGALKAMSSRLMSGLMGMASGGGALGPLGVPLGYMAGEMARMPVASMTTGRAVKGAQNVIDLIGERQGVQDAMRGNPQAAAPQSPVEPEPPAPPMLALPAPKTTVYGNSVGQNIPLSEAGRESIGQQEATHNPAFGLPQPVTSPSEMLQQYGNARLFDADKLPPIIERPSNPGAAGNAAYQAQERLNAKNRPIPPSNEPHSPIPSSPTSLQSPQKTNSLPYKDYTAEAQKIVNTARATGNPIKNDDMARILGAALKNRGATQGEANTAIAAILAGSAAASGALMNNQPATSGIGQQNMQELQKVKPQSSNPNVQSFAKAESGGNPNAKNPNSSASGLYQFTNKTWADMVMRHGKETGITISDKSNPQAQATMASLLAKDNIKTMSPLIGRMPTLPELYAGHVLGAHGAAKLINANPQQEAIMIFPRQVTDANRPIFFQGNRPRTVAEVKNILTQKVAA